MSRGDAAMVNLSDENRDLMLSLYLDGELEPEQAQAVAEKIRSDEAWQREYTMLRSSETRVTKVVEDNWHDEDFTAAVRERLRAAPPPEAPKPSSPKKRKTWLFWTASVLMLAAMTAFLSMRRPEPPPAGPPSAPQAAILNGVFRMAGRRLQDRHDIRAGDEITTESDLVSVRWDDNSRLWLRKGTVMRGNAHGSPSFASGRALIKTAPEGVGLWPSKILSGTAEGPTVELRDGTFDVEVAETGLRVRVLAGTARRSDSGASAGAGQTLTSGGNAETCDPRDFLACWGDSDAWSMEIGTEWPPAWPQSGGSAGHTGVTPVYGPSTLKFEQDLAFDDRRETDQLSPAIVRGGREIYVVRQDAPDVVALYCYLDIAGTRRWASISQMPGRPTVSPAISSTGLVLFGTNGKLLRACNYSGTAWEADLDSALSAITVLPDGLIVCSTFQRLVAFGANGKERWSYQGLADFQSPVALSRDGELLAVSRTGKAFWLSLDGKELTGRSIDFAPRTGPFGWPVIQQDGSVWITTPSGELLRHNPHPTTVPTPPEGNLLLTAPPLADGTCAVGHEIVLSNGTRIEAPGNEAVIALAGDGAGRLYAATQNAVHLYACSANGRTPPVLMESAPIKQGRMIPAGLAIAPGKLIVTTTGGVVVFAEQP
jgi:hypothetical protein